MSEEPHPWGEFLRARYNVIVWMAKTRNRTDWEIAKALSMDEGQVTLIRMSDVNVWAKSPEKKDIVDEAWERLEKNFTLFPRGPVSEYAGVKQDVYAIYEFLKAKYGKE